MYEIAKSKLFDLQGLTSIEAANKADLYQAFNFLAHEKAHHRVLNPPKLGT